MKKEDIYKLLSLNEEEVAFIDEALKVSQCPDFSRFITQALVNESKRLILESYEVKLSDKEFKSFIGAISSPSLSNPKLKEAFELIKKMEFK